MTTRLIIKGNESQALHAAVEHGVTLSNIKKHPYFNECVADTELEDITTVRLWFIRSERPVPFPPGTLIWFGEDMKPMQVSS